MKRMYVTDSAHGLVLAEEETPKPEPSLGELLIRVCAAGVTTTELQWYPTSHTKAGEKRIHAVPGHEFSGVVAGAGKDVDGFAIGQEVFGMNDWFADGAMAEYCLAQPSAVTPKPPNLTHVEAASVPIGSLTAWQGLLDHAKLQPGESVLVHGGAGAVGVFAVQLARLKGARVIATASARNLHFVASLGAERTIDYRNTPFEGTVRKVDVVFDTVGGETLERSWGVLKPNGRMVTVAAGAENASEERVKNAFFIVEPNRNQLSEIGDQLEAGRLKTVVDAVFPLAQASDVFTERVVRRGRGKLVVEVADGVGT